MKTKIFSLLLIFLILTSFVGRTVRASEVNIDFNIIGYITWNCVDNHYSLISSTDTLKKITHMIGPAITWTSSTDPTLIPAYSVTWSYFSSKIPGLISACHANNVKFMCQIGFPKSTTDLAALSSANKSQLATNIVNFISTYGMDGVELDIEVPDTPDQTLMGNFIKDLRSKLPTGKILSTIGMAGKYTPDITVADSAYVDWIDVMCYDFSFASPKFETAKYADTVAVMQKYLGVVGSPLYSPNFGFSASKLILGTPFYGYNTTNGSSVNASVNYHDIADAINPAANVDEAVVNGLTTWWSGIDTTVAKANWAVNNGLAGVMGLALGYDKLNDSRSLLKNIYDEIHLNNLTSPTVTTDAVSGLTSTKATLNANLTNNGSASSITVSFEYGLTTAYGSTIAGVPATMSSLGAFTANLNSLTPNTLYHYRAKAVGDGTSYGSDQTFSTLSAFTITTTLLANGQVSTAYNQILTAYGGTTPYTWSISTDTLPDGLTLSTSGVISGTPTITGTSSFIVMVTDKLGSTAIQTLTIVISTLYPAWDVNEDGAINGQDIILVVQHMGETGNPGWIKADVNKDGVINVLDTILIGQNFNQ